MYEAALVFFGMFIAYMTYKLIKGLFKVFFILIIFGLIANFLGVMP